MKGWVRVAAKSIFPAYILFPKPKFAHHDKQGGQNAAAQTLAKQLIRTRTAQVFLTTFPSPSQSNTSALSIILALLVQACM